MFSTVTERPVLLVGSIPLSSVEEVFEKVSSSLGRLVRRIPDGEIGDRATWISWQRFAFKDAKGLIVAGERKGADGTLSPRYAPETTPANVEFPALGYAREALASYRVFAALRDKGKIAAGTRFQVSLPTPLAVVFAHVMPDAQRALWPRYESCLFAEVDQMSREIPHRDLAIQWDIAVEINGILEVPEVLKKYSWDDVIAPLSDLRIAKDTELYLGLVHFTDGIDGAMRRLTAAQKFVKEFGIATECGFGRRPSDTIPALLSLHREIAALR
jgi:hypothetical protein